MRTTVGGWEAVLNLEMSLPRRVTSSSWTILTICSDGREGGGDLGAQGLGADVLDELRDDGEVDVGLEEGEADLAHGVGDVFVGDGALAAEVLKERWSLSERFSNMVA